MDNRRFDLIARAMATDGSRRQLLGRLAGSAAGSLFAVFGPATVAAQDEDERKRDDDERKRDGGENRDGGNAGQNQECRGDGHPCEGNQQCCVGLVCAQGEPGAAFRCTAAPAATTCEGDCPDQVTVEELETPETELGQRAQCRRPGEECGPDAICCDGLPCEAGKDGVTRCVGDEPVETCAETCAPVEVKVRKPRSYKVETDCRYDDADDRTTCDCLARSDDDRAPKVKRVTLSQADVCAEVVAGEFSVTNANTASAGNGGNANAEASGGQVVVGDNQGGNITVDASGGAASANAAGGSGNVAIAGSRGVRYLSLPDRDTLRLTFAGKVEATGTATYWCETDTGIVPAIGPALARAQDDVSGDAGAIVVRALACDVANAPDDFDWYGQCRRPAKARLRLRALQGGRAEEKGNAETDDAGRRTFRQLAAGTYRVAPEGEKWCHAECDSVDDNGDVVLQTGQRVTVYVFHCGKA